MILETALKMLFATYDEVHGFISFQSHIADIIHTPIFTRLKHINQLGTMKFTTPKGKHTRYDHSIGTFHLARRMLDALVSNSGEECRMTHNEFWPSYRLAVEIAALLHDVGHGPFSHTWERVADNFHHEANAIACVDAIFDELMEFPTEFQTHNPHNWIEIVKALIIGQIPEFLPSEYKFIFEIVNNIRCGLDVDKWDYLLRDKYCLDSCYSVSMNFDDVFLNARISADGGCIEYRYCDYGIIYDLFSARQFMHAYCYRNPINGICDVILRDIVKKCNKTICGLSINAITSSNISAFLQLTDDNVIEAIKNEPDFKYLQNPHCIKVTEVTNCAETNAADTKDARHTIVVEVPAPGNIMPADDQFKFYGNMSDKPKVERDYKTFSRTVHFTLPSNVGNEF